MKHTLNIRIGKYNEWTEDLNILKKKILWFTKVHRGITDLIRRTIIYESKWYKQKESEFII